MSELKFSVTDCDGHILESIAEMAEFIEAGPKDHALHSYRNREGVFPSLDGLHAPNSAIRAGAKKHTRVTASQFRPGSGEDWAAFVEKAGIDNSVLFTSEVFPLVLSSCPPTLSPSVDRTTITSTSDSRASVLVSNPWR